MTDLRAIGVVGCGRCHNTGLVHDSEVWLAFCDCATGRALWDTAMTRALAATMTDIGATS